MSRLPTRQIEESILDMSRFLLGADRLVMLKFNDNARPERLMVLGESQLPLYGTVMPALAPREAHIEVNETGVATAIGCYKDKSFIVTQFERLSIPPEEALTQMRAILPYFSEILATENGPMVTQDLTARAKCLSVINQQISAENLFKRRRGFSVIRASLNRLDQINQHYGWETANQIISELLDRVSQCSNHFACVAHCGGGSFIFVTPTGDGRSAVGHRTDLLNDVMRQPVKIEDIQYAPDISFATASYPENGQDAASLLRHADLALEKKRQRRRQSPLLLELDATPCPGAPQQFEQDLIAALDKKEFLLEWQPITSISSMRIVAREALLRWQRPGSGMLVSAATLIPCAETSGLIECVDAWSLKEACRAAALWQNDLTVCVNISPSWLCHERLARLIEDVLTETSLPPSRLQIDFSEKTDFGPSESVYRELAKIRAMGVKIALDDFGSGYSSLERLSLYPVDKIKVARSFLLKLEADPRSRRILQHIVHLARSLNIICCAKGVETEHQMAFLASYGYEEVQGFLVGAPKSSEEGAITPHMDGH